MNEYFLHAKTSKLHGISQVSKIKKFNRNESSTTDELSKQKKKTSIKHPTSSMLKKFYKTS